MMDMGRMPESGKSKKEYPRTTLRNSIPEAIKKTKSRQ